MIGFLVVKKETVLNIHKRLSTVYGNCTGGRSTVSRLALRIKSDESLHKRLSTSTDSEDSCVWVFVRGLEFEEAQH